jgi:hypothetical protein
LSIPVKPQSGSKQVTLRKTHFCRQTGHISGGVIATKVLPQLPHFHVFSGIFVLDSAIVFLLEICICKSSINALRIVNKLFADEYP